MGTPAAERSQRDDAAALRAFARQVRAAVGRAAASHDAMHVGLPVALALLVMVPFVAAPTLGVAVLVGVLVTAAAALVAYVRARRLALHALGDDALPLHLHDGLATWLEQQRRGRGGAMLRWLEADLGSIVATLHGRRPVVARRRLGRVRHLLPLVLLLVLLYVLGPLLSLRLPGLLGGASGGSAPTAGRGAGDPIEGAGTAPGTGPGEPSPSRGEQTPEPEPKPDATAQDPPPEPPSPPPPRDEPPPVAPEPPPPEPPAPFLDLPAVPQLVVPEFVHDGPSRRALAERATVESGGAAPAPPSGTRPGAPATGSAAPGSPATGSPATGAPPAERPHEPVRFARAAEQALRARHVPDEERAMVRRFFALLQEHAK